mgnify:CR=1 FL=1
MSRRFVLTLSVFLFTASFSLGQCDFIRADRFDNIWVIHNSEVICFDKQQKKIGSYSNILLGKPSTIDVLDPFRVVVFYPSTQTLVILNNAVAEIANSVNIRSKGVNEASLVCRSSKGGFWVFDRSTWQILHFDSGFNSTGEKFNPDMQLSGSKPVFMQEYKGVLYVAFEGKAICRFDSYGARMGDILVKINGEFTFWDGELVYISEEKIFGYNLESNQSRAIGESIGCIPVKVNDQFLFFDGSRIAVHKLY